MIERAQGALAHGRTKSVVAYVIILATCLSGVFHLGWWAACAGACSLALISLITQRAAPIPQVNIDGAIRDPVLIFSAILNASAVASGAFIFGHVARWFWGL